MFLIKVFHIRIPYSRNGRIYAFNCNWLFSSHNFKCEQIGFLYYIAFFHFFMLPHLLKLKYNRPFLPPNKVIHAICREGEEQELQQHRNSNLSRGRFFRLHMVIECLKMYSTRKTGWRDKVCFKDFCFHFATT